MTKNRPIIRKIRAGFIGPCTGIGGADMLMLGLMKYAYNIEWSGIVTQYEYNKNMIELTDKATDWNIPIHAGPHNIQYPCITYHPSVGHAAYEIAKNSDILITWCWKNVQECLPTITIPVIEYAQNSDEYARQVVESNKQVVQYKAACSRAAASVFDTRKDVTIIYNGIDPGRVVPRKGRAIQRRVWGIPENKKVLLFMGRLVKEKHPEDLLKALQQLPEEWIGLYCGTGEMQQQLYEQAQVFAPDRVAFVNPEYHVGDFLASADCFLLTSDFEGHPLALMEAMLAGVPCVYSNFTVMKELEDEHGPLGVMVNRAEDNLSDAVLKATTLLPAIQNAKQMVWDNFTLPMIANQWEEYLTLCLHDYHQRRRLTPIFPVKPRKPYKAP